MWNWLLVKLRLRTDWTDPKNAPPFISDVPHEYQERSSLPADFPLPELPCCKRCGGGSKHPIHHGKQVPYQGVRLSPEYERAMREYGEGPRLPRARESR